MEEKNILLEQDQEDHILEEDVAESGRSQIKKRRFRFVLLTLVVMCIIGYLIFSGMQDTMGYYLTVSELIEQSPQSTQEKVRVSGKVNEGSVNWDPAGQRLAFAIIDGDTALSVEYHGVVPDSFKQGQKVIIEGVYNNGTFLASELMTTCASKYE